MPIATSISTKQYETRVYIDDHLEIYIGIGIKFEFLGLNVI